MGGVMRQVLVLQMGKATVHQFVHELVPLADQARR